MAITGLNKLSSLDRSTSSFKAALYGRLLWVYVSFGLRLKPQNLPSHNEWSPSWWGIYHQTNFPVVCFCLQHFWQKCILNTFVCVKWQSCLALYPFLHAEHRDFSQCFSGHDSYQCFFKEILSSFFMRAIKVLSPSPSIHSIGVPLAASSFTPINSPVLSISQALPVSLHTHLCFLTERPSLFLCHHLHTPYVLWLTTVLTTFLPYFGLLMKKAWANKKIERNNVKQMYMYHAVEFFFLSYSLNILTSKTVKATLLPCRIHSNSHTGSCLAGKVQCTLHKTW